MKIFSEGLQLKEIAGWSSATAIPIQFLQPMVWCRKSGRRLFRSSLLLCVMLALSGCLSPIAMHRAVMEYDRTVSQVQTDMLLLNIARARYRHHLHFTAVANVAATFDFRTTAGFTGQLFEGVFAGAPQGFTKNFYTFNLGASMAENPTVNIIPIQGEEFAKRILAPMDQTRFEFLYHRGADPAILLRLVARSIVIEQEGSELPAVYQNTPSQPDGYREFRRRVLHLSALHVEHALHIGPLVYQETWPLPVDHVLTKQAFENGYHWSHPGDGRPSVLTRDIVGQIVITNYDPARLTTEERHRLHEEAQRYPRDQILVDIRAGHPGGEFPLHGRIQLRSFESVLSFLARGIAEELEFAVEKDPRTGETLYNPPKTIEVVETESTPPHPTFTVEFEGHWFSIGARQGREDRANNWDLEAFRILYQFFQLTVTDVSKVPTLPITIAK